MDGLLDMVIAPALLFASGQMEKPLKLIAPTNTTLGFYTITLRASSGAEVHRISLSLVIADLAVSPRSL